MDKNGHTKQPNFVQKTTFTNNYLSKGSLICKGLSLTITQVDQL